jgi:hypothetical protein
VGLSSRKPLAGQVAGDPAIGSTAWIEHVVYPLCRPSGLETTGSQGVLAHLQEEAELHRSKMASDAMPRPREPARRPPSFLPQLEWLLSQARQSKVQICLCKPSRP